MAKDVGIPGIAPEDVPKVTAEQQAQIDRFRADMAAEAAEPEIELLESEIMAAMKLGFELRSKYGYRKASFENLSDLRKEAEERFYEIGLIVQVDWIMAGLSITPTPPTIDIIGRVNPINRHQQAYEIGKGVADEYYDHKRKSTKNTGKAIQALTR